MLFTTDIPIKVALSNNCLQLITSLFFVCEKLQVYLVEEVLRPLGQLLFCLFVQSQPYYNAGIDFYFNGSVSCLNVKLSIRLDGHLLKLWNLLLL
jgi:hypothetical protein